MLTGQRLTGTDEKDIVIFAIGRLDLRINFDFSEPMPGQRKERKPSQILGGEDSNNRIPFIPTHTGRTLASQVLVQTFLDDRFLTLRFHSLNHCSKARTRQSSATC